MNSATKFLVMVLFIGVVCANVDARKLQKVSKELLDQSEVVSATKGGVEDGVAIVSKETRSGINGLGAELVVTVTSTATNSKYANGNGAASLGRPGSGATGSTYGRVTVDGLNANAYSKSVASGESRAMAATGHDGATGNGYGFGYAYTNAGGTNGNVNP